MSADDQAAPDDQASDPSAPVGTRIDPRMAHNVPAQLLQRALPGIDQRHLTEIRQLFAAWLGSPRGRQPWPGWAEAFDAFTGADMTGHGSIEYRTARCEDCRGGIARRPSARNLGRTGSIMICGTCMGSRRGSSHRQRAVAISR